MAQLSAKSLSVLLVDSSADEREMYAESLRRAGLDIVEASTNEEALIKAPAVAVVVTDLHVSRREDGLQLIRRLRRAGRTRDSLIVVLTASVMQLDRYEALCAGCDAFVAKPCRPAELLTVIQYLVRIAPELRQKRPALRRRMQQRYTRFRSEPTSADGRHLAIRARIQETR